MKDAEAAKLSNEEATYGTVDFSSYKVNGDRRQSSWEVFLVLIWFMRVVEPENGSCSSRDSCQWAMVPLMPRIYFPSTTLVPCAEPVVAGARASPLRLSPMRSNSSLEISELRRALEAKIENLHAQHLEELGFLQKALESGRKEQEQLKLEVASRTLSTQAMT